MTWVALHDDRRGVALTEFALTLPVILLLFLAGYQVSDAIACKRKVTTTTRAVADLTTQPKALTASDVTAILNASTQILSPYSATRAFVRVSQVAIGVNGAATVSWSRAIGGTPRAPGSTVAVPATLKTNGTYLVLSEISYAYDPSVRFDLVGPLTLVDTLYMSPRNSESVSCPDC